MKFDVCCVLVVAIAFHNFEVKGTGDSTPQLVRLVWGDDVTSIVVMWSTGNMTTCIVNYAVNGSDWLTSHSDRQELHSNTDACPFIYRSVLRNLTANSQYKYFISCEDGDSNSSVMTFATADNSTNREVRFIVYGDLGYNSTQTFKTLLMDTDNNKYDGVFHIGDIAYNLESNGGWAGDTFFRGIENISSRIPYMTAPGNHEIYETEEFTPYRIQFSIPGTEWPIPIDKMWYSYDIGHAHIISYSTEVYFTNNQNYVCQQYYGLLDDLLKANSNRDKRPWIIAMGHRPFYCSNNDNNDDCTSNLFFRRWVKHGLEDLFYSMGVDLIIEAHEHSYERLWPTYDGVVYGESYVNPRAPVHIISGSAGGVHKDSERRNPDEWSASRSVENGIDSYGHLHIINETHLFWDQVRVPDLHELDSIWLVQNRHGPFVNGVNCNSSASTKSNVCSCPFVFHYETAIHVGIACSVLIFATCAFCIVKKLHKRCTKSKTKKWKYGLMNDSDLAEFTVKRPMDPCDTAELSPELNCERFDTETRTQEGV